MIVNIWRQCGRRGREPVFGVHIYQHHRKINVQPGGNHSKTNGKVYV